MRLTELDTGTRHERVVECVDDAAGYHGIIAIHDTTLGPAVGGTRLWAYASRELALGDALRLSEAMSYKAALAGVGFGGGKAVVIGDSRRIDRERVFRAHGRFIETLGGEFITGEDVGTTPADMLIVRGETRFAAGLDDPSPATARGVRRAMQAAAAFTWHDESLRGRTVAIQGCGKVGYHLARELAALGAELIVADTDARSAERAVRELGARMVDPAEIQEAEADIFAPCALGGALDVDSIARLRVALVVGAANNQLRNPLAGALLGARGILYVPDYVANAGGIIHGAREIFGWTAERSARAVDDIFDVTMAVLRRAAETGSTTAAAADELAARAFQGGVNGARRPRQELALQ